MSMQIVSCFWLQRYDVVYMVYQLCIMPGLWLCNLELEINGES